MHRFIAITFICALASVAALAADFDYGTEKDLQGVRTFFVDSHGNLNSHHDLTKRIEEATGMKPSTAETADVVVSWNERENCGHADVLKATPGKPLLVFQWEDCGKKFVNSHFLFVRKFAAAYKKANPPASAPKRK
jgi:hypothetical protein